MFLKKIPGAEVLKLALFEVFYGQLRCCAVCPAVVSELILRRPDSETNFLKIRRALVAQSV